MTCCPITAAHGTPSRIGSSHCSSQPALSPFDHGEPMHGMATGAARRASSRTPGRFGYQCPCAGREVAAGPPNHQAQQSGRTAGGDEPGGFIPIEPELDRPADRRLGANDIDGLLTRRSLLSEAGDPTPRRRPRGASSAASARTRCGARCSPRPTRARPTCRLTKAKDTARRLSRASTVKWAPVETRDGHAVLPKVLARPLKAATRDPPAVRPHPRQGQQALRARRPAPERDVARLRMPLSHLVRGYARATRWTC